MKVLNGGYNRYKYEVYENSKTENLVNLTLIKMVVITDINMKFMKIAKLKIL